MAVAPDSILGEAISTVTKQMSTINGWADNYQGQLSNALSSIGRVNLPDIKAPDRMDVPESSPPQVDLSGMPEFSPPSLKSPDKPSPLDLNGILSGIDLDDLQLPEPPEAIPLNMPDAPNLDFGKAPERPDIDTNIELPEAPDLELPELDALEQIELPNFEFPELPTFDAEPPNADGLEVPDVFVNWSEPTYESENLDLIETEIARLMEGGTGLPEEVENALFSRARERASAETERAVQEAVDSWASRDFSMPPGMLLKQADATRQQGRLQASEANRDIMVEATKWQIESLRFAVEQGLALEQLTTNLFENATKRMFEAAKFSAEAQISVFDAQVSLFNAQNATFDTFAKVYQTKLEGALSKLTAYKTAVEGQIALGEINKQRVDVFKAKIDAIQNNVNVYKAVMDGAKTRADVIKNQFDAYRSDIQAFAETVNAEKAKVDIYETKVNAETAKTGVLDSQARAYASTVQAVSSKSDMKVKQAQVKMDEARIEISRYLADVDSFKAELQAGLSEAQYVTEAYAAQVEGWKAQASAGVADAEMQSRFADMNTRTNIANAEMQISEYQAQMTNAVEQAKIALESSKAMGQYTAQLAAGAMSAAHVSAGITGSGSASSSDSKSTSTSTNHNYNY